MDVSCDGQSDIVKESNQSGMENGVVIVQFISADYLRVLIDTVGRHNGRILVQKIKGPAAHTKNDCQNTKPP